MAEKVTDLVLHPVRMRIILALVHGQQLTPLELAAQMPDVPQATLYRHIKALAGGGLLAVVEERQVRGAVEKVYALAETSPGTPDEVLNAGREEHLRWFTSYLTGILGSFERYLAREAFDMVRDGVGYWQIPLHMTPEEFDAFNGELRSLMQKATSLPPTPGRLRRTLSLIHIPEPAPPGEGEQ